MFILKNKDVIKIYCIAVFIFLFVIGTIGWVKNIIKLSDCDFEAPYKAEVIHTIGIVPIIGAITGWMDIGK